MDTVSSTARLKLLFLQVQIRFGERSADGRNLIDLMGLHAECGHSLQVEISGEDERDACQGIEKLLKENL